METAILAGGCFWCLEAVFVELNGVTKVESGYIGGNVVNPTYNAVCMGTTGHAESVRIAFDPDIISYRDLLNIFFWIHDPTTLNRQGMDIGTQYRSEIFYINDEQKTIAEDVIRELEHAEIWDFPVITEVAPASEFYVAEDYHQDYFANNPNQPYCVGVVAPKVVKARKMFMEKFNKGQ